ncbi:MAG: TAT-variant-translocated molybdopterin oxidoreductase, partial [Verrucomicrobiota bacterium]
MSKKVFQHPAPREGAVQPWRSLEERNKSPEFLTRAEREFVDGASAAVHVHGEVEVDVVGHLVDLDPADGLAGLDALLDQGERGAVGLH